MRVIAKKPLCFLQVLRFSIAALFFGSLIGCSLWNVEAEKYKPIDLGANIPVLKVRQAWVAQLGTRFENQLLPHVHNATLTLASDDGIVAAIDTLSGNDIWRLNLAEPLVAGVGSDGFRTAVVSRGNELILLEQGREKWRHRLAAQVFTSPLVAGGRVFVLAADHTISAFDAVSGHPIWSHSRSGEGLVLRQSGILIGVDNTLLLGVSGRLVGINPDTGVERWQAPIATPRGTNDLERLVELVAPASRVNASVCVRAFQAAVGCVNVDTGAVDWTRKSSGTKGLDGNKNVVYGVQDNGIVNAWNRADGSEIWFSERLKYRKITAPVVLGQSIVVGDEDGLVHFLSREDGAPLNRLATDGSGVAVVSVSTSSEMLVAVTRKGYIYGFRQINEK